MTEGNAMEAEQGVYIFPARGMGRYDDRSYRQLYKCKEQELCVPVWTSLLIDNGDVHKFDEQIAA